MATFGASTGAAAALMTAADRPDRVRAVISRGGRPDLADDALTRVTAPTLLIWGEEDLRAPLPVAEDLREMIAGSTLTVVPGAGHLTAVEAPERFNAELRAFVGSIDSGSSVVWSQDPG